MTFGIRSAYGSVEEDRTYLFKRPPIIKPKEVFAGIYLMPDEQLGIRGPLRLYNGIRHDSGWHLARLFGEGDEELLT